MKERFAAATKLICEASVIWNEVWQGYPDHFIKVVGSLLVASEMIEDTDSAFAENIKSEANRFQDEFSSGNMYRPQFEKMASYAINAAAGNNVVPEGMVLSTQLCYDCAVKHVLDASYAFKDWMNGEANQWMNVIGNLSQASTHLIEKHSKIANVIRDVRKSIWEALVKKEIPKTPDFEGMVYLIFGLADLEGVAVDIQKQEVKRLMAASRKR